MSCGFHDHRRRTNQPAIILLAEDDRGDQELTRRALMHSAYRVELRIVEDGEQALDYLFHRGAYSDPKHAPYPDLILLDLNMPRLNGREVLAEIKKHRCLARLPVVVLTTSVQETDILRSYDLGCNSYIQKPVDVDQFTNVVRQLGAYWLSVVTLPSHVGA